MRDILNEESTQNYITYYKHPAIVIFRFKKIKMFANIYFLGFG